MSHKVALLGNMNNNYFSLARFLRDRGIDAHLLMFRDDLAHFHPSADTYSLDYMDYCHQLSWGGRDFLKIDPAKIERDLSEYDFLIGSGYAPSYCLKAGRKLDVFFPYGEDIWGHVALPTLSNLLKNLRIFLISVFYISAAIYQRKALKKIDIINMGFTNDLYEEQVKKICKYSERWFDALPMVYTGTYNKDVIENYSDCTHWYREFKKIRDSSELMIMSQARHVWGGSRADPNQKGNDILIKGFAQLIKKYPELSANLVLLEYGNSIPRSKRLIEELGIEDSVKWFPIMYRKDLVMGLSMCDIACDQFVHSWVISGSTLEALALGKPLMKFLDVEKSQEHYDELYPFFNVHDENRVTEDFEAYLNDRKKYDVLGEVGRKWYQDKVVNESLNKYVDYINATLKS